MSLEKNSFSLLETIIAITVISILVGGFLQSSAFSSPKNANLHEIKNEFLSKNSTSLSYFTFGLIYEVKTQTNVTLLDRGDNRKLQYHKKNVFLEKYTINVKTKIPNFKEFN